MIYLFIGLERFARDTDWEAAFVAGWLALCVAVPYLFFVWGRRRPARAISRDIRVWILAGTAAFGIAMALVSSGGPGLVDTINFILFMPAFLFTILWVYLWKRSKQAGAMAKAEKMGWRLSEKEEANLGGEEALLDEMTPRQRLRHNLIIASGLVVFPIAMALLIIFKAELIFSFVLLVQLFILNSVVLIGYYSKLLRRQLVQRKRGAVELEAARRMQMALMPSSDPVVEGFEIAGLTLPAEEVGGDLFAYMRLAGRNSDLGIVVADVSGKAMKAAIATVLVSGMIKLESGRASGSSEILSNINRALLGSMDPYMFVAMQVVLLEPSEGRLYYSNAGQVHPMLLKGGALSPLEQNALPLGIAESAEYEAVDIALERGSTLFLVSDGITEAMNERREIFGSERLERALLSIDPTKPARVMLDELFATVDEFRGNTPPSDDRTIVIVKRV